VLTLSVLDQSPVPEGSTPADALRETLRLAELCDSLGYRRYWLAEHHNTGGLAGSAPEVLIGQVAARTSRLRVGSGGVMLSHYAPLKVAESFRVLEALFPGRIDLAVGRAPGSDQLTAAALAPGGRGFSASEFPAQVADLVSYVNGGRGPIRAQPLGETAPAVWLLGSSATSALLAAQFGLPCSFAHFINPVGGPEVLAAYRERFRPSPFLAEPQASIGVGVICAETDDEAQRLASSLRLWRLRLERGDPGPVPTPEEALAHEYTEVERVRLAQNESRLVVGSPARVRAELDALAAAYGVDEVVVVTICHDQAARRRSYELLAKAFELDGAVGAAA
jgi:luciferase family oxidoreductase group 1